MKNILFNILAVISGLLIGSFVNMFFIKISGTFIPAPTGVDLSSEESLKAGIHLFEAKHFIFPFVAHATGSFIGAFIAALIAKTHRKVFAFSIGAAFLLGGISMVIILPAPLWFNLIDLVLAYIPTAFIGYKLAQLIKK